MTITEANAASKLLRALAGEPVDVEQVVAAAAYLNERVHQALAAGPRFDEASVRGTLILIGATS